MTPGNFLVPATVLGELEAGFEPGRRMQENWVVLVLETTPAVARRYGRIFAKAACLDSGGQLLTFDRDFGRIDGLEVVLLED